MSDSAVPAGYMLQPEVKGYRQLTPDEVLLMNAVKFEGERIADLVERLKDAPGVDGRWVAIGVTHLQQGLMALTRSVARPTTFA